MIDQAAFGNAGLERRRQDKSRVICAAAVTRVAVLNPNAIEGAIDWFLRVTISRPRTPPSSHSAFSRTALWPRQLLRLQSARS